MSRRLIAVLVALAIAVATLASSAALGSSNSTPKGPAKAQKNYTFYLVAGIASDAFYLTMSKGAKAAAKKLGNVKVVFTGSPAAFSPNTQIPFHWYGSITNSALFIRPSPPRRLQRRPC